MKKLFASVLAVSMAITGVHVTSYASEDAPMVSVEAQKSNPYMSELDKELKDFFAKYNAEKDCSKKERLLDAAINEVQSKIDSHAHFLNVMSDSAQRENVENKFAALKLKHSILSTVKTKEQEKQAAVAQKEYEKRSALDEKDRELRAKDREMQVALDKKEQENKLEREKLKELKNNTKDVHALIFVTGMLVGGIIYFAGVLIK